MSENTSMPRVEHCPDDPDHFLWFHACTEIHRKFDHVGGKLPLGPSRWQWQEDGSLRPSIKCLECQTHGFWDGPGGWRAV